MSDPATPDSRPSDARRRLSSASALMLFIGILMLLPGLCVLLLAWVVVSDVGPYRTAQSKLGDLGKFMLTTGFGWFWILCLAVSIAGIVLIFRAFRNRRL